MPKMVSVHQVNRPVTHDELRARSGDFAAVIGDAADPPEVFVNPNDATQVALVGQVHDLDALRERSRSEAFAKLEKDSGFSMTQLFYFLK